MESLTEEEARTLHDATAPIYRQCGRCEKTTGWIGSARPLAGAEEPVFHATQGQPMNGLATEDRLLKSQKRMATQAERDQVNSMMTDKPAYSSFSSR